MFGRFLPAWHGIGRRQGLREALVPLQGIALPAALWESDVLPRRVASFRPAELDVLCASGEVVWVGAGLDRVAVYFRDDAPLLGPPAGDPAPEGEVVVAIRAALAERALFWADLVADDGVGSGGRPRRALGAGLGRGSHERLVGAASCNSPVRAAARRSSGPAFRAHTPHARVADAGALVARIRALRRDHGSAGARGAPPRATGHRDAGRRSRRGDSRRLRRRVRRAEGAGDARRVQARVLRRGPRRRPVRPARRGRAAARASLGAARRGTRGARARRGGSRAALRRSAAVAAALRRPCGSGRRGVGDPARRRGGALRRAWRPVARAAARSGSWSGFAQPCPRSWRM